MLQLGRCSWRAWLRLMLWVNCVPLQKDKCCIKCCQCLILLIFYILKEKTGSEKGATILREWEAYLPLFWQLVPPSEEDSPEACAEFERVLARQATTQLSAKWSNQTSGRCYLSDTPCKVIFLWLHQQRRNRHMWSNEVLFDKRSNEVLPRRQQFCGGSAKVIFWSWARRTVEGSFRRASCTLGNPCKLVCWH